MRIARVTPETVRPLRLKVLRPHQTPAEQVYEGDDGPGAAHFAAYEHEQVIGIASITPQPYPHGARDGDWRIRGMATDPEAGRGLGAGGALLRACLNHARAEGGTRVWCNARSPVRGFYEREGFAVDGQEFVLDGIGPHFLMWLAL
jgi:predicted GNAT family N-acyltransferase